MTGPTHADRENGEGADAPHADATTPHVGDPAHAVLVHLAELPYADAKRRLVALFDETYTTELLRRTNGNLSEAARRAGLDRSNFRRLLKRHAR